MPPFFTSSYLPQDPYLFLTFSSFFSLYLELIRFPSHFLVLSCCAGVSRSVYSSSLSFFALPSSLALLQRLPGSFQFSRNFDLPSRFCYTLQTKEEVRTAALLNVQASCNKVCINNASWNTDFFFLNCRKAVLYKIPHSFYSAVFFCLTFLARENCQEAPSRGRISFRSSRVSGTKAVSVLAN